MSGSAGGAGPGADGAGAGRLPVVRGLLSGRWWCCRKSLLVTHTGEQSFAEKDKCSMQLHKFSRQIKNMNGVAAA